MTSNTDSNDSFDSSLIWIVHSPEMAMQGLALWFGRYGMYNLNILLEISISLITRAPINFLLFIPSFITNCGPLDLLLKTPVFLLSPLPWPQSFCMAVCSPLSMPVSTKHRPINPSSIFLGVIWARKVDPSFWPKWTVKICFVFLSILISIGFGYTA